MSTTKKKVSVSFVIREGDPALNSSGVNRVRVHGHTLYSAGRDSIIRRWETNSQGECHYNASLEHHTDWVNDVIVCSNGKTLMSASSDTTLKVWDADKSSCLSTLKTHRDYVKCLAYAPGRELVASAGLDRHIYLWDVNTLTALTTSKNTVTTSTLTGHKDSVYSVAITEDGSLLISGSTEKVIRVWDPRTAKPEMKLKGHSDNVRALAVSADGTLFLSGSSDSTVRLWSLGQQRCVETFRIHEEGVWALAVDSCFQRFYSAGRDQKVYVTELNVGSQEGDLLCSEDAPVLSLALGGEDSIWVSTTKSCINQWPAYPSSSEEVGGGEEEEGELEEDGVTDVDSAFPCYKKPLVSVPGGTSVVDYRILSNKREVVTKDTEGKIVLWDVLHACAKEELGADLDLDQEAERRKEKLFVPNWFSVEIKTGILTIKLSENDCFGAWVMGSHANIEQATGDIKLNLGALMLKALFECWTKARSNSRSSENMPTSSDLIVLLTDLKSEWFALGKGLGVPEQELEKVSHEREGRAQECLEEMLKHWLSASEEPSWSAVAEAVDKMDRPGIVKRLREKENDKMNLQFFSVPGNTPVILAESGDCGTTHVRFLCSEADLPHESRQISNFCPHWILNIIDHNNLPPHHKINFSLSKLSSKENGGDRLSAQDILSIHKVYDYAHQQLYGEGGGKVDAGGEKVESTLCLEVLCGDKVLSPDLDLRTVKHYLWKGGGDVKLSYRERAPAPAPTPPGPASSKPKQTDSNDSDSSLV